MVRYQIVDRYVEAEQWYPDRQVAGVFLHQPSDFVLGNRDGTETRYPQAPYWAIQTSVGLERIRPGDWVLTRRDGRQSIVDPGVFSIEYEPAPEGTS